MPLNPNKIAPNRSSESQDWIQFHKALKDSLGKKEALHYWTAFWSSYGGEDSRANDNVLRTYMEKQGVTLSKGALASIVDTSIDIGDTFGGMFSFGRYMMMGLSIIVIGGIGMIVFNVGKKPIEAAKAAAALKGVG